MKLLIATLLLFIAMAGFLLLWYLVWISTVIAYAIAYISRLVGRNRFSTSVFKQIEKLHKYNMDAAEVMDIAMNVIFQLPLRWALFKEDSIKPGRVETISFVIGANVYYPSFHSRDRYITKFGLRCFDMLDWLDPLHCEKAIYGRCRKMGFANEFISHKDWLLLLHAYKNDKESEDILMKILTVVNKLMSRYHYSLINDHNGIE